MIITEHFSFIMTYFRKEIVICPYSLSCNSIYKFSEWDVKKKISKIPSLRGISNIQNIISFKNKYVRPKNYFFFHF